MKFPRRTFLHLAEGAAALPAVSRIAWAQTYPARPITMIVPFAAGGPNDGIARIMAERMRVSLGQPVMVENTMGPPAASAPAVRRALHPTAIRFPSDIGAAMSRMLPFTHSTTTW